jgi:hypothetical protein
VSDLGHLCNTEGPCACEQPGGIVGSDGFVYRNGARAGQR